MKRLLAFVALGLMGTGAVFAQENVPTGSDISYQQEQSQDQVDSANFGSTEEFFIPGRPGPGPGPHPGPGPGPRPGPRPGPHPGPGPGPGPRPGPHPGPHPGPGPGPRPGPRPPAYVCYAENARGQQFSARGWDRYGAQREAMNECYRFSRQCRPMGCQRY